MGEDRYRVDRRIVGQRLQHRLQRVARVHGAVAIVDVIGHVAPGRPGEQHRRDVHPRVVNDLGEAINGFLEAGVEAVDEDENPAPGYAPDARVEVRFRLSQVHAVGAQDDEIMFRIARRRRRDLDVARLARAVRRNRDGDVGEIEPASPRAAEHDARRLDHGRARRRDEKVDLVGAGRGRPDDQAAVWPAGAAGCDRSQSDDAKSAEPASSLRRGAEPTPRPGAKPQPCHSSGVVSRGCGRTEKAWPATRIRSAPADRTCRFSPAPPRGCGS